jgi:hypothetical protein
MQESSQMARPRLELGTPRFSGTGNWCRKSQKSPANRPVADRACSTFIPVDCRRYPRVKDVAGLPCPFRLQRKDWCSGHKASVAPRQAQAAPARPKEAHRDRPSTRQVSVKGELSLSGRCRTRTLTHHVGISWAESGHGHMPALPLTASICPAYRVVSMEGQETCPLSDDPTPAATAAANSPHRWPGRPAAGPGPHMVERGPQKRRPRDG